MSRADQHVPVPVQVPKPRITVFWANMLCITILSESGFPPKLSELTKKPETRTILLRVSGEIVRINQKAGNPDLLTTDHTVTVNEKLKYIQPVARVNN